MSNPISPEPGRLLALRRVRRSRVNLIGVDLFLDQGRRIPGYLHDSLRDLLADGYLYLGERHESYDQRRVLMTTSGDQLHRKLENPESRPDSCMHSRTRQYILPGGLYTGGGVTKRLIDVDDQLLVDAQAALGADTYKDTVHRALERVVSGQRTPSQTDDALRSFAAATRDLSDPDVMDAAWR